MKNVLLPVLVILLLFNTTATFSQMKTGEYGESCELNDYELNMTAEKIDKDVAKLEKKRQVMDDDRWKLARLKDLKNYQFNHSSLYTVEPIELSSLRSFKIRVKRTIEAAGFYEKSDPISGETKAVFRSDIQTYEKDENLEILAVNMRNYFDWFRKEYAGKIDDEKVKIIQDEYKAKYSKLHKNYILSDGDQILTCNISFSGNCYLEEWTNKYKELFFKELFEQVKLK